MSTEKKETSANEVRCDIHSDAADPLPVKKHNESDTHLQDTPQNPATSEPIPSTDPNPVPTASDTVAIDETDKYEHLFAMTEAAFNNEESRYDRTEDTAHKYIPIMLFLVSAEAFFANRMCKNLFPLETLWDYLVVLSILIGFLALIVGIYLVVKSFRIEDFVLFRPDIKVISAFDEHNLRAIYRSYSFKYIELLEKNMQVTNRKMTSLKWAYKCMLVACVSLVVTALLYLRYTITAQHDWYINLLLNL